MLSNKEIKSLAYSRYKTTPEGKPKYLVCITIGVISFLMLLTGLFGAMSITNTNIYNINGVEYRSYAVIGISLYMVDNDGKQVYVERTNKSDTTVVLIYLWLMLIGLSGLIGSGLSYALSIDKYIEDTLILYHKGEYQL